MSLRPVAARLAELLGRPVAFVDDCIGEKVEKTAGALKDGDNIIGGRTRVKVVKNKMAPPFKEAEFDILYGTGISRDGEIVDLGSEIGVVEKSGAWYSFAGERIGQGREAAKQFLKEHPDTARVVISKIREKVGVKSIEPEPPAEPAAPEKKSRGR